MNDVLTSPLVLITALLALGVLVHWSAARFRFPAVILLLGAGLVLGPALGVLDPDELFGDLLDPLISLAVGFVLFEGGLSLRVGEAQRLGAPLYRLVVGGLTVSFLLGSFLAHYIAGLSWTTALTISAILIVTGPTVIRPMLRQAKLAKRPALLLKWEGIVNDPLGALFAVIVVEVAILRLDASDVAPHWWTIPVLVASAGALGSAAGYLFGRAMDGGWIPEHLKTPCMVAGVAVVFTAGESLFHEAGLLATTAMGVVFANFGSPNLEGVRRFKEDVTTLLVALLFLVLSARLSLSDLQSVSLGELAFVGAVLLVLRPAAVLTSFVGSDVTYRERALIGWIAPRGVVAAAMAAALAPRLVDVGVPDADRLVPVMFAIILATVVLHGITVKPFARRLGLSSSGSDGLLVVGASRWAVDLAVALGRAGVETVVVDSDFRSVNRGRLAGAETHFGEILDEETLDELPTERLGMALAATTDDHYNALVSVALYGTFGRENVAQLTPAEQRDDSPLQGRVPWGDQGTFAAIARRYWAGRTFRATSLTEQFDAAAFQREHEDACILFTIDGSSLSWFEGGDLKPGTTLVHLS